MHLIDDSCKGRVTVRAAQIALVVDHRDVLGALAEHLTSMEGQVKNLLNIVDTINVVNMAKVEDSELLFIAKKTQIG